MLFQVHLGTDGLEYGPDQVKARLENPRESAKMLDGIFVALAHDLDRQKNVHNRKYDQPYGHP